MARLPNKVIHSRTKMLEEKRDELLQGLDVPAEVADFKVYMVSASAGRCDFRAKNITVPRWAWSDLKTVKKVYKKFCVDEYLQDCWIYYLAHELAHACAGKDVTHGPEFMRWFIKICPPELQFFELGYKPKNAAAAGIKK